MDTRPLPANQIGADAKAYLDRRFRKEREFIASRLDEVVKRFNSPQQGPEATDERFNRLERRVAAIWDVLNRKYPDAQEVVPKVKRDSQGLIVDELLRDLIYARADTGLSRSQLARVLDVKTRTLNDWINRRRAPKSAATRDHLRQWIDEARNASGRQIRMWKGQE